MAAVSNDVWYPGIPSRAKCNQGGNMYIGGRRHEVWDAPASNCTCGFYCYKNLQGELLQLLDTGHLSYATMHKSLGQVKMWGKIVEHELGYRAQYVYPHAIIVGQDVGEYNIAQIRKHYHIEVAVVPNIEQFLRDTMQQLGPTGV